MKVFMLTDEEAYDLVAHVTVKTPLHAKLLLQMTDALLGAPGERTLLIRQGTPPLMMANFDSPEDAESVWREMASHEDRLALAADIVLEDHIDWPH